MTSEFQLFQLPCNHMMLIWVFGLQLQCHSELCSRDQFPIFPIGFLKAKSIKKQTGSQKLLLHKVLI